MSITSHWRVAVTHGFDKLDDGDLNLTALEAESQIELITLEGDGLGFAIQGGFEKAVAGARKTEPDDVHFGSIVELARASSCSRSIRCSDGPAAQRTVKRKGTESSIVSLRPSGIFGKGADFSIEAKAASSRAFLPELVAISRLRSSPAALTLKRTTAVPIRLVRGLILCRSR